MSKNSLLALPLLLMLTTGSFGQAQTDSLVPTIPATQIKPAELSSPYEFLSAATSADDFIIKAGALAATNAESPEVKSLAAQLAAEHSAMMKESQAAGKSDQVDIATPSVDGEQKGLLGKLEPLTGADFDRAFVEAQIFVHQRTIAYYSGYADEGNNLAQFAATALPKLVEHYTALLELAETMGLAKQAPAVQ